MNVLQLNQRVLRALGICLERNAMPKQYWLSVFANGLILASFYIHFANSAMYFYYNWHSNMGSAIFSLMQMVALTSVTGTYSSIVANKNTVADFFNELQEFVDESSYISIKFTKILLITSSPYLGKRLNPEKVHFYCEAERRSIPITKWPFLAYCAYLDSILAITTIYTIIFEMIPGHSEPATWYLTFKTKYGSIRQNVERKQ